MWETIGTSTTAAGTIGYPDKGKKIFNPYFIFTSYWFEIGGRTKTKSKNYKASIKKPKNYYHPPVHVKYFQVLRIFLHYLIL